jgi:hypothetical protein
VDRTTTLRAVLRRNWWVVTLGIVVSLLSAAGAYQRAARTYTAVATGFLVPARSTVAHFSGPTNPYTTYGSADADLGLVATAIAGGNAVSREVRLDGGTATFSAATASHVPVITITATGRTSTAAAHTASDAISALQDQVERVQAGAGVPTALRIVFQPIREPARGTQKLAKRLIVPGAVGVLGILSCGALALAVDSLRHHHPMIRRS